MKPVIGIIMRPDILDSGNKVMVVYEDIRTSIINSGGIPIGISPQNIDVDDFNSDVIPLIDKCDGVIFQGGDRFYDSDLKCLKYVYENDIPVLGICLGMQMMGYIFNGEIGKIKRHYNKNKKYLHKVYIDKKSKLYTILKHDNISVNSRHVEKLINTNLDIIGVDEDDNIEAIEDPHKKFFIGVQWHPENMYLYDSLAKRLFDYFIDVCRGEV